MRKNIVGDWGSHLSDPDYARHWRPWDASRPGEQYSIEIVQTSRKFWRRCRKNLKTETSRSDGGRRKFGKQSTPESWRETRHEDAQTLADGWRLYSDTWQHPRQRPRLAVNAAWRNYPHLFDFDELLQWLGGPEVGCEALVWPG